ncbi:MAG: hypothetical protein MI741_02655 [Rhodospirillales bacterium]|nr:hypothetical protein [Rhodospirillales bacterium]
MSTNRYQPHVRIVPEDHANEQIANGFVLHDQVNNIAIERPASGWRGVLDKLETELVPYLNKYKEGRIILLIDFDDQYHRRRERFDSTTPDDLKDRVFVIGAKVNPEELRRSIGMNFETIGNKLAEDCYNNVDGLWTAEDLSHNEPDLAKLLEVVRPILFPN